MDIVRAIVDNRERVFISTQLLDQLRKDIIDMSKKENDSFIDCEYNDAIKDIIRLLDFKYRTIQ